MAYIIDVAILTGVGTVLGAPVFIAFFVLADNAGMLDENAEEPSGAFFAAFFGLYFLFLLLILAAQYVYLVEMQWRSGQTVGKRVMKIRIMPLDPGVALTRGMAGKRFLVQVVAASCVPLLGLLDGLWQLWDKPYQQCLHDKFAETVVVKVGP